MGKVDIRKNIIDILQEMERTQHVRQSSEVMKRLVASKLFQEAGTIAVTISRFPEVDTRLLIEHAWQTGKRVVVPKCIASTREMDFRAITSFDDLETVYMDLLEPIEERTSSIKKDEIDLQLVPGVVFSEKGFRIGFGGGYYDRYLEGYNGECISLAFEVQLIDDVPVEPHDIPVDWIITENRSIDCGEQRRKS
ncbi:5-formyltetrahydrofolate cyclo-ligase [Sporosarcina oncorhynchi]|uniref:5-formyltetrahydrofolate cyclo-ligase n=1 Tax=Sporosarcina oncorhynchi TaxID=3056444 RepID=A0ABZ0L9P9_9BACL|nr:5-formyltetrahydrofolate cyclo-ligase [Sporosarcina sp. T2O-4]WOV88850.1 5-formyltetrahydrofolate cyclo-ligase [Sporosarcina sp. T2O-4]